MIELTKENKGITLIALIITIIVMLILTSVVTYSGIETYKSTQVTKFVTQMQLIQTRVDDLVEEKNIEELLALGATIPNDKKSIINTAYRNGEILNNEEAFFRYFNSQDLKNELDLDDGIDDEILVNFKTREVVTVNGIEYNGTTYYTQYKLPNAQTIITDTSQLTRDLSFDLGVSIDGLKATITIRNIKITNGTLSYREVGTEKWLDITNYTQKGKEFNVLVSKTGKYEFKLTDNTTGKNSNEGINQETVPDANKIEVVLINKPNTYLQVENKYNYNSTSENWVYVKNENGDYVWVPENWAYVIDVNGDVYVWIPRFAYKTNEETNETIIKFIKGNSNVGTDNSNVVTDNSNIDTSWKIHNRFNGNNNSKFTGIWVKVEGINQAGINMIKILDTPNIITLTKV